VRFFGLGPQPDRKIREPRSLPSGNVVQHVCQIGTKLLCGLSRRRTRTISSPAFDAPNNVQTDLAAEVDAAFDKRSAGRDQEFADLTANRSRLDVESDKFLAAHFADAIDLPTLKRHQDRIRAALADFEQRLADHNDGPAA